MSNFLLDETWAARLKAMWRWQRGFRVMGAASFVNSEAGCTIAITAQSRRGLADAEEPVLLRIAGNHTGQGKYDAYVIRPGSNTAGSVNLGATNNVSLDSIGMVDGERVILWNVIEHGTIANTDRSHLLSGYAIGFAMGIVEAYSGTNTRRVFAAVSLPYSVCNS